MNYECECVLQATSGKERLGPRDNYPRQLNEVVTSNSEDASQLCITTLEDFDHQHGVGRSFV